MVLKKLQSLATARIPAADGKPRSWCLYQLRHHSSKEQYSARNLESTLESTWPISCIAPAALV